PRRMAGSASCRASSAGLRQWVEQPRSIQPKETGRRSRSVSGDEPLRVLVVDDHPIWRDAVARDLEAAGLIVCGTASDVAQAVRVATATRPDVVVLDLQLPDGSGVDVARRIGTMEPAPRILVLSASGEQPDVIEAVAAGATGYLVKSASTAELVAAVESVS